MKHKLFQYDLNLRETSMNIHYIKAINKILT